MESRTRVQPLGRENMWTAAIIPFLVLQGAQKTVPDVKFYGDADLPLESVVKQAVNVGVITTERFFRKPFPQKVHVEVMPNRAALDGLFAKRWNAPRTEKWMVAAGVADFVVLLSPKVWPEEAVEHDNTDLQHVRRIVAHELTHMYHAQNNKDRDMEKMDEVGWFVEGLATYASGQLHEEHEGKAKIALKERRGPKELVTAWSGKDRYSICGSMVEYIDRTYGRRTLIAILPLQTNKEILGLLKVDEVNFLSKWADWVARN